MYFDHICIDTVLCFLVPLTFPRFFFLNCSLTFMSSGAEWRTSTHQIHIILIALKTLKLKSARMLSAIESVCRQDSREEWLVN